MKILKIVIIAFLIYYLIGLILVNRFVTSLTWRSDLGPTDHKVTLSQSLQNPASWTAAFVWPLLIGVMTQSEEDSFHPVMGF